jgi:hypothetical protein
MFVHSLQTLKIIFCVSVSHLLIIVGISAALLLWIFYIQRYRSRRLRGRQLSRIEREWNVIERLQDPAKKIMEADKILDEALRLLDYQGSLGEKLKKAGPRFSNLDALWRAHKLRNRLAHELRMEVSAQQSSEAIGAFRKALRELGMR